MKRGRNREKKKWEKREEKVGKGQKGQQRGKRKFVSTASTYSYSRVSDPENYFTDPDPTQNKNPGSGSCS